MRKKRFLSLALALAMLLSLCPITAMADSPTYKVTIEKSDNVISFLAEGINSGDAYPTGTEFPVRDVVIADGYEYATAPQGWTLDGNGSITGDFIVGTEDLTVVIPAPTRIPTYAVSWDENEEKAMIMATVDGNQIYNGEEFVTGTEVAFTVTPRVGYVFDESDVASDGWGKSGNAITRTFTVGTEELNVTIPEPTETVAEIFGTPFASLAAAFAAAEDNATITLKSDAAVSESIILSGEFTLDLNRYTLTYESEDALFCGEGANLTIDDSSDDKTGCIYCCDGGYIFGGESEFSVTINAGCFDCGDSGFGSVTSLVLNGGKFTSNPESLGATIPTGYEVKKEDDWWVVEAIPTYKVTIEKSDNVIGFELEGIDGPGGAYLTGTTFTVHDVVIADGYEYATAPKGWKLDGNGSITGDFIVGTEDLTVVIPAPTAIPTYAVTWDENDEKAMIMATVDGNQIYSGDEFVTDTVVTFTLTPRVGYVFDESDVASDGWGKSGNAITKTVTVANEALTVTIPEPKDIVAAIDDTPFASLAAAFAAAEDNAIITLKSDAGVSERIILSGEFTLNLNGYVIAYEGGEALFHSNGGSLTIVDTNEGGSIVCGENSTLFDVGEYSVSIVNGTFDCTVTQLVGPKSFTLIGGKFKFDADTAAMCGFTFEEGKTLVPCDDEDGWWIVAAIPPTYAVTWEAEGANATVKAEVDGDEIEIDDAFESGTEVAFTVTPEDGYEYDEAPEGWTLNGNGTITQTFTVGTEQLEVFIPAAEKKGPLPGRGTGEKPYLIASADDLAVLNDNLDKEEFATAYFKQTNDIALTDAFDGIGKRETKDTLGSDLAAYTSATLFKGTYDGDGHTVSGLILNTGDYVGFFNSCYGATIKNLKISLGNNTGWVDASPNQVGAVFIGVSVNTTLENCETVVADGHDTFKATKTAAGLIGYAAHGTVVRDCVNNLNIWSVGNEKAGGLIACAQAGKSTGDGVVIDSCANEGYVKNGSTNPCLGGFVGYADLKVTLKGNNVVQGTITPQSGYAKSLIHVNEKGTDGKIVIDDASFTVPALYKTVTDGYAVDGLFFATVDGDVATLVKNDDLAANGSYKVMATGAAPVIELAEEQSISFDQTLAGIDATGITAAEGCEIKSATEDNVITYTAAKISALIVNNQEAIFKESSSTTEQQNAIIEELKEGFNVCEDNTAKVEGVEKLAVELKKVEADESGKVSSITYDVTPKNDDEEVHKPDKPITFELPVTAEEFKDDSYVKVEHEDEEFYAKTSTKKGDGWLVRVVKTVLSYFSEVTITPAELGFSPVALIKNELGERYYATMEDAKEAAKDGDVIKVLASYAASLTLNENINVNFYVAIPTGAQMDSSKFSVKSTFPGSTEAMTPQFKEEKDGYRYYRAVVAEAKSYQMNEKFSVEVFYDGVSQGKLADYSVRQYLEKEAENGNNSVAMRNLCAATLSYGGSAQRFFSGQSYKDGTYPVYTEDDYVDKVLSYKGSVNKPANKAKLSTHIGTISDYSASLVLGNEVSLKIYFTTKNAAGISVAVKYNDEACAHTEVVEEATNRYSFKITGIRSLDLSKDYEITVTQNGMTDTITYSPYVFLKQNWEDASMSALCKAIKAYGDCATEAFSR